MYRSLIQLSGYDYIPRKKLQQKGGLITYIGQQFNYELNMKLNTYKHCEGQIIQVNGRGVSQTITIGNIYRPPRPSNENYNEFLNEFTMVILCMQNLQKIHDEARLGG